MRNVLLILWLVIAIHLISTSSMTYIQAMLHYRLSVSYTIGQYHLSCHMLVIHKALTWDLEGFPVCQNWQSICNTISCNTV